MANNRKSSFQYDKLGNDPASLKRSLSNRLIYSLGKDPITATHRDWFHTTAYAVRERLIERWMETMRSYYRSDAKRVYYLSMEFLTGRLLANSLLNMGFYDECREALADLELDIDRIRELEADAALGNGGLGRLAACFLDSMATLRLPGYGYGIRYEYGMFNQRIENGYQVEHPDNWLRYGNPWEFPRPEVLFPVKFGGRVVQFKDEQGHARFHWVDTEDVMAMAYDTPVPGYDTTTVNNMRLWSAKASRDFNLKYFNEGNYIKAVEDKNESENLSKVLYPDDTTLMGRELRLKQQYFFVCASLQDILRRFTKFHPTLDELPDKVAIQLNDTHPAIAIPELMRVLIDVHRLDWDRAWDITRRTFSYTNHTLMPEALETWPVSLFEEILPRHLQIIYEINYRFLEEVRHRYPGDVDLLRRMSIVDEAGGRRLRMAHLAIVGSHHGERRVADPHRSHEEDHLRRLRAVLPRQDHQHHERHHAAALAAPGQSRPVFASSRRASARAGSAISRSSRSSFPLPRTRSSGSEFRAVKQANKERLAEIIKMRLKLTVDPASLFDVQIKRIHEYKRQLLNVLHIVTRYNRIRAGRAGTLGAAHGDLRRQGRARLCHGQADHQADPQRRGHREQRSGGRRSLKVVFIPDYNVSNAEKIIPACDLSEQISTAGTEASGTGNMKLALNGALTIGTLDGANIEMKEEVGRGQYFHFRSDGRGGRCASCKGVQSLGHL